MTIRRNKYRVRTDAIGKLERTIDGHRFDSKAEAKRYAELVLMVRAGEIRDLRLQPRYPLEVNGERLGTYVGDFAYYCLARRREIVEDVKSGPTRMPVYLLKRRLMEAIHGIEVVEVR